MGSPYTGPDALKKGPLFVKKVATNQGCKAPPLKEGLGDGTNTSDPASYLKGISKSTDNISVATTAPEPKPEPQETGLEPKGKDSAKGLCESPEKKKIPATTFLTVPGPHSPGPIKSPRPMSRPAFPFAWPLTRVAPSMSSLNSLASSCFDLTDVSLHTEYAPFRLVLPNITCMKSGQERTDPCTRSRPGSHRMSLQEAAWTTRKNTGWGWGGLTLAYGSGYIDFSC